MTDSKAKKFRVGVVGVGNIGRPIAERLIECGMDVLVCDPSNEARSHFAAARTAASVQDAANEDAVLFLVANDSQLEMAMTGPGGLTEGLSEGGLCPRIAIMSTVTPETVNRLAEKLARYGASLIDAPVSGGAVRASAGRLTVMAGGSLDDVEALRPILELVATAVHYCGPLGHGQITKIINNMVGVTNLLLFSEAMHIAGKLGMDLERLCSIMEQSSGRNAGTANWNERLQLYASGSTSPQVTDALMKVTVKDLGLARALAIKTESTSPILDAVASAHSVTAPIDIFERWRCLCETSARDEAL